MPQTNATDPLAIFFGGYNDQGLGFGLATAYANFDTAQIALINLDRAEKPDRIMARRSLCKLRQAIW